MQGMKHVTTGMYQKSPFSLLTHSCIRIHNFLFFGPTNFNSDIMGEKICNEPPNYPFWFGGSASCMAAFFTHPL